MSKILKIGEKSKWEKKQNRLSPSTTDTILQLECHEVMVAC